MVERVVQHPFDRSGSPTEWLVIAETLSDARTICMEGPAGILRVLERRKIKHRYKMSPRPMVLFPDGAKIYTEGADDPDVGRGYNASGAWLDEMCVAQDQPIVTRRGNVAVQEVLVGDEVLTRAGWRTVSWAGCTGTSAEVLEIATEAGNVRVTANHRVWADGRWVRADALKPGSVMECLVPRSPSCHQSPARPLPSVPGTAVSGTTTSVGATTSVSVDYYIGQSGQLSTARFRQASRSTIRTGSHGTIGSKTSKCSQLLSIEDARGSSEESNRELLWFGSVGAEILSARSARSDSKPGIGRRSTAPGHAAWRRTGATSEVSVLDVRKVGKAAVFDLTVDDDQFPEFFAGDAQLLVHNCKWRWPKRSWEEGIMPSLRADLIGDHPRAFVTTTPKPIDILQEWVGRHDGTVHVIRGSTFDNKSNLSPLVIEELKRRYEGTAIGKQELYGEIIEAFEGALFNRLDIENARVFDTPDNIVATVVGVDPSLTGEDDEMGIVVACRDNQKHMYVLADRSVMAVGRAAALEAWRAVAEFGADKLVVEENLGKKWMQQVFTDAYKEMAENGTFPKNSQPPLVRVDARVGKRTRGEPVAMRCEQGRLHMVGRNFQELEDQMATFTAWGQRESPDRLDALVHACRWLMDGEKKETRITSPSDILSTTLQELLASNSSYHYG